MNAGKFPPRGGRPGGRKPGVPGHPIPTRTTTRRPLGKLFWTKHAIVSLALAGIGGYGSSRVMHSHVERSAYGKILPQADLIMRELRASTLRKAKNEYEQRGQKGDFDQLVYQLVLEKSEAVKQARNRQPRNQEEGTISHVGDTRIDRWVRMDPKEVEKEMEILRTDPNLQQYAHELPALKKEVEEKRAELKNYLSDMEKRVPDRKKASVRALKLKLGAATTLGVLAIYWGILTYSVRRRRA